jgi:hypothetical protein
MCRFSFEIVIITLNRNCERQRFQLGWRSFVSLALLASARLLEPRIGRRPTTALHSEHSDGLSKHVLTNIIPTAPLIHFWKRGCPKPWWALLPSSWSESCVLHNPLWPEWLAENIRAWVEDGLQSSSKMSC